MLEFQKIRYKNFLSSGNSWTEIDLDGSKTTLIVGDNGSGKSTMLDAICFALYGKPFRNINKIQLCNSITMKHSVVECEFIIGGINYLVRRGIKPEVFEIFQNGNLINQSSTSKDYQGILEKNILKINYKSFNQVVILGSANFVPFMQLPAQSRREFIEDLLDIQIFSLMNNVLKEKIVENREKNDRVENEIKFLSKEQNLIQDNISSLKNNTEEYIKDKHDLLKSINVEIQILNGENDSLLEYCTKLHSQISDFEKDTTKNKKLLEYDRKLKEKDKVLVKEISFYQTNDNCPTCKQNISETFKVEKLDSKHNQKELVMKALADLKIELKTNTDKLKNIISVQSVISEKNKLISDNINKIFSFNQNINLINSELDKYKNSNTLIENNENKLIAVKDKIKKTATQKEYLIEERQLFEISSILLKDGGIKTKIVRQYVPIINKLVNKYLTVMDFFVQFEVNENFKESIKSRYRDDFTYASFSEGEKARLDLALLFAWRAIAKMRNSATTNLLILDEVFDSSLDECGNDFLFEIISTLGDSNVFCISHKGDKLYDKFDRVIKFEKVKNFSQMHVEK